MTGYTFCFRHFFWNGCCDLWIKISECGRFCRHAYCLAILTIPQLLPLERRFYLSQKGVTGTPYGNEKWMQNFSQKHWQPGTVDTIISVLLTYSMVQSPSWEANWFSASQEIPRILWNLNIHYRLHKCPPPIRTLSQNDPDHALHSTSCRRILILSSHLRLGLPSGLIKFHIAFKLGATFKSNETELIWAFEPDARWKKTALYYFMHGIVYILILPRTKNVPLCTLFRQ